MNLPKSFFTAVADTGQVLISPRFEAEDRREKLISICQRKDADLQSLARRLRRYNPKLKIEATALTELTITTANVDCRIAVNLRDNQSVVRVTLLIGRRMPGEDDFRVYGVFELDYGKPGSSEACFITLRNGRQKVYHDKMAELGLYDFLDWLAAHGYKLPYKREKFQLQSH